MKRSSMTSVTNAHRDAMLPPEDLCMELESTSQKALSVLTLDS